MKTIEQKAKAYDEALSVARKTHQTQPMYRDWLEKMFPELAESEDERIRKALIWHLTRVDNEIPLGAYHSIDGIEIKDMLAWLEKQCEKPQRIVSAEAKEAMYDKPAPVRTGPIGFDGEPMESKPCEQKPAEWSKEDGQYLLVCKNALAKYQVSDKWDATIISQWLENKLKSLRPRSQWKPSDEQMSILRVLSLKCQSERQFDIIGELIEQLKVLQDDTKSS